MDMSRRWFLVILLKCLIVLKGTATDQVLEICSLTKPSSSLIIIYDEDYAPDKQVKNLTEDLSKHSIAFAIMDIREVLSYLRVAVPKVLLQDSFERIHIIFSFLVLCQRNATDFLRRVEDVDKNLGFELVLRHFSTWLFVCDDQSDHLLTSKTTLDNVILMATKEMPGTKTLMWKNGRRQFENIALKSVLRLEDVFPNTKLGFNNRVLRIGTMDERILSNGIYVNIFQWPPFVTKEEGINGSLEYRGLGIEIIYHFAAAYNFTCTFIEPDEKHWGDQIGNNTWTGFIGMLQRREVDVGLAYFAYNDDRGKILEYSYFFKHDELRVYYKKPEVDPDRKWKLLMSIFKWKVYLCGAVTIVAVSILLVVFEKWNYEPNLESWRRIVPDILSMGINVPLRQGSHVILHSGAGLVLLCFWWLFCIIVTSVYTGNLTAVITVEREKVPFSNLKELSEHKEYEVGLMEGSFFKHTLQQSNKGTYKKIWEKLQGNSIDDNQDVMTQRKQIKTLVQQGKFAFLATRNGIMLVMGTRCGLSEIKGFGIRHSSSLVYAKHSPLARLLSTDLQWLFEIGWITATEDIFREKDINCLVTDHRAEPLELKDLLSALLVCVCGVLAATVVLVVETTISRFIR